MRIDDAAIDFAAPPTDKAAYRRAVKALRARSGMVFQAHNLFPHRTVLGNLLEGPVQAQGRDPAEAAAAARTLLDQVGLTGREDAYPAQLSGGQQQRVGIARALALRPEVLLLDEPTSALDPELVGEVLAVIRDVATQGWTMVIVTHEVRFGRDVADQVLFLYDGVVWGRPPTAADRRSSQRDRSAQSARSSGAGALAEALRGGLLGGAQR